jgi:hypothetical protein
MTELREMCEPSWWAVSIICPANKDGIVDESKFMAHYGDARQFGGTVVVANNPVVIEHQDTISETEVVSLLNTTVQKMQPPNTYKDKKNKKNKFSSDYSSSAMYDALFSGEPQLDAYGREVYEGDVIYVLNTHHNKGIDDRLYTVERINPSGLMRLHGTLQMIDVEKDTIVRVELESGASIKNGEQYSKVQHLIKTEIN